MRPWRRMTFYDPFTSLNEIEYSTAGSRVKPATRCRLISKPRLILAVTGSGSGIAGESVQTPSRLTGGPARGSGPEGDVREFGPETVVQQRGVEEVSNLLGALATEISTGRMCCGSAAGRQSEQTSRSDRTKVLPTCRNEGPICALGYMRWPRLGRGPVTTCRP